MYLLRPFYAAAVCTAFLAQLALPARASDYITTVENTPNLLGYWRFSSASQANSEVNGYTGTFNGGAAVGAANSGPTLADDPSNSALQLNGTNGYVSTNLTGQISTQGSIVGWFNLSSLPSVGGHIYYIAGESQSGDDFDLQIETDNMLKFYTEGGGHTTYATAFTAADLNTWHFFAATLTAGVERDIYLDGTLVANTVPGGHSLSTSAFNIGESDVFTGRYFGGGLDEIAIYNRDLTASEVSDIYNSRLTAAPEPSSLALFAIGSILLLAARRRRKRA